MELKMPYNVINTKSPILGQTPDAQAIQELGFLTICAIRYCFGRESAMPSTIVEATKANWELLSQGNRETILRDVAEALQTRSMGTKYDINMWVNFYEWMLNKGNAENI